MFPRSSRSGLVLMAVHLVGSSTGCFSLTREDECSEGEGHCSGTRLVICEGHDDELFGFNQWRVTECGSDHRCIDLEGELPFCALSGIPDPNCESGHGYCDGTSVVSCQSGFATQTFDCGASDATCVLPEHEFAMCTVSSEPDPRCAQPYRAQDSCDGQTLLGCYSGYVTRQQTCPIGCIPTPGGAFCAHTLEQFQASQQDAGASDASL